VTIGPKDGWTKDLRAGYDRVASHYADAIYDELKDKPFDRALLDRFFEAVRPIGTACDLGCGPGQVARYLRDRGLPVFGLDLSTEMVVQATRLNPDIQFEQGTMLAIPRPDRSLGGIAAFYSIIHIARPRLAEVFGEMRRVLRPMGSLLVAFHLGPEDRHVEELLGKSVSMDFFFFERAEIEDRLEKSGFTLIESIERDPYPDVEHQSRRAYILARKRIDARRPTC
jgi:SAM-dependent methyltransferase